MKGIEIKMESNVFSLEDKVVITIDRDVWEQGVRGAQECNPYFTGWGLRDQLRAVICFLPES